MLIKIHNNLTKYQLKFYKQTQESQVSISAQNALNILKEGNKRFNEASPIERNYANQIELTKSGKYQFAEVLSCIDSRVPTEIIFDQGIGDLFNARVAENCLSEDVLGNIEYDTKYGFQTDYCDGSYSLWSGE
ncbi:MAG: hypothetical protein CMP57_03340 [Flavobacteriales bacterium]|nr:hypothetical protein [Flavobacteriales bacterium]